MVYTETQYYSRRYEADIVTALIAATLKCTRFLSCDALADFISSSRLNKGRKTALPVLVTVIINDIRAALYLPQLGLTKREGVHEGLSDDGQAAVQMRRLLHVKNELRVFEDVDPKAQRQTERTVKQRR